MRLGRRRAAARHLRALATLEVLIAQNQIPDARRLLDGIDPVEARSLAAEIERPTRPRAGRGTDGAHVLALPALGKPW